MNNNISKYTKCSYCCACMNTCPTDAIKTQVNGLYYSLSVDEQKCIGCGKCVSVCPVNIPHYTQQLISGYAGYVDDDDILYSSSSGGAFYAVAQTVLKKDGAVYGAAFTENSRAVVFQSTDEKQLHCLQKSKYVESDIGYTFRKIEKDLKDNRFVMFCGTPCQAAGLKRFLGLDYENLLVCDFSCGGLPSHVMFDDYLNEIEKNHKSKIDFLDFRPKNYGWQNHSVYIQFQNGRVYTRLAGIDPYFKAFLHGLSKRDYCYSCDFANNHASDLIFADFWLYNSLSDLDNQDRGLSLVLTNSEKGETIMKSLSEKFVMKEIPLSVASYNIKDGHANSQIIDVHNSFLHDVSKIGFIKAVNRYLPPSVVVDWKCWIKQVVMRKKYEGSKKTGDKHFVY